MKSTCLQSKNQFHFSLTKKSTEKRTGKTTICKQNTADSIMSRLSAMAVDINLIKLLH